MKQIEWDFIIYRLIFLYILKFCLISGINFSKISHEYINILYLTIFLISKNMSWFLFDSMLKNVIIYYILNFNYIYIYIYISVYK